MKRKILLTIIISVVFIMTFTLCAFAVDYNEKATLADGEVLPIYDENQNPLIWWVSGTDAEGNNIYSSVPNNRNEANAQNDTYVTYTINKGYKTQLENINIHIWNDTLGAYEIFTEENVKIVVVNLRGLSSFIYIHNGLKVSDIQYIYFNENLLDFCDYFKGSTSLRLVDLTACTDLSAGLGGSRNFYNCTNLHTVRLATSSAYTFHKQGQNWLFAGTAIKEIIVPANITSLGIDNFRDCKQLESIYILGNTTDLGQRNFYNCGKLTNIYFLGDNPEFSMTELSENFISCVDGATTYDFTSTGKYFFFATENASYLNDVKETIGAIAVVPYSEYKANPQNYTEGRYIISGTTACDALYGGAHTIGEQVNDCQATCGRGCGALTVIENPTHNCIDVITYGGGLTVDYMKEVAIVSTCERCGTEENTIVIGTFFEEKGYSAQTDGIGIVREFSINSKAIDSYKDLVDSSFEYGMVVAIENLTPITVDGEGNITASNNTVIANFKENQYNKVQIKVVNIPLASVDVNIVNTIFARANNKIYYANIGEMAMTAVGKTFNDLKGNE